MAIAKTAETVLEETSSNNKEVITYEIDEKDLDRINKLVFSLAPEKYEPTAKRIAIWRP